MKTTLVIITLTALFCVGCLTEASKINGVAIGMSKGEVLKIMGKPVSVTADEKTVSLNYALHETGVQIGLGYVTVPYEIKLVNDKVVSFGRALKP